MCITIDYKLYTIVGKKSVMPTNLKMQPASFSGSKPTKKLDIKKAVIKLTAIIPLYEMIKIGAYS